MPYYSPKVVAKIKEIDLLSYLQANDPDELVKSAKGTFETKTHDSLKISNGMWYWFSRGIGGKSALEYLIEVKEMSFLEAMGELTNEAVQVSSRVSITNEVEDVKLIMPIKNDDNTKAIQYLISRGIDREILYYCVSNDLVYQEKNTSNVVFVGYGNDEPQYAALRGSSKTRYFKEARGSDKATSFKLISDIKSDELHVFESAIDVLSYATLLKMHGKVWSEYNFLSLAGIYKPAENLSESKTPVALTRFLNEHQQIKELHFHLDNDAAGKLSTKAIKFNLENNYEVINSPSPRGKDINDFLLYHQKKQNRKRAIKMKKYSSSIKRTTQFYIETEAKNEEEVVNKLVELCEKLDLNGMKSDSISSDEFDITILNQDIQQLEDYDELNYFEDEEIEDCCCGCKYCMKNKI